MRSMLNLGTSLVLLVDDYVNDADKKNWKQLYDPDIDHLINAQCILPVVWKPKDMVSIDVALQFKLI